MKLVIVMGFAVGTPDEVGRALVGYRDKRLTHLSLNFHQPGMATNAVAGRWRCLPWSSCLL